jgi:hypothetical protein
MNYSTPQDQNEPGIDSEKNLDQELQVGLLSFEITELPLPDHLSHLQQSLAHPTQELRE